LRTTRHGKLRLRRISSGSSGNRRLRMARRRAARSCPQPTMGQNHLWNAAQSNAARPRVCIAARCGLSPRQTGYQAVVEDGIAPRCPRSPAETSARFAVVARTTAMDSALSHILARQF
jgi:hypothetical protein